MSSEDCAMAGVNEPATIGTETPVTVSARPVAAPSRRRRTKDRSVIFWSPWAIESKDATAGTPDSSRTYYRQAERQPNCLGGMPPQLNRQSAGFARLGAEGQRLALGIPAERAGQRARLGCQGPDAGLRHRGGRSRRFVDLIAAAFRPNNSAAVQLACNMFGNYPVCRPLHPFIRMLLGTKK